MKNVAQLQNILEELTTEINSIEGNLYKLYASKVMLQIDSTKLKFSTQSQELFLFNKRGVYKATFRIKYKQVPVAIKQIPFQIKNSSSGTQDKISVKTIIQEEEILNNLHCNKIIKYYVCFLR